MQCMELITKRASSLASCTPIRRALRDLCSCLLVVFGVFVLVDALLVPVHVAPPQPTPAEVHFSY